MAVVAVKNGGFPLVAASVATLGHVRGRGPMDTSSAEQDEVDIGRDGADGVGGTEPRPRGFPSLPEEARQPDAEAGRRKGAQKKGTRNLVPFSRYSI